MHPDRVGHVCDQQPLSVTIMQQIPGLGEPAGRPAADPRRRRVAQPGHQRKQFQDQSLDGEGSHVIGLPHLVCDPPGQCGHHEIAHVVDLAEHPGEGLKQLQPGRVWLDRQDVGAPRSNRFPCGSPGGSVRTLACGHGWLVLRISPSKDPFRMTATVARSCVCKLASTLAQLREAAAGELTVRSEAWQPMGAAPGRMGRACAGRPACR